MAAGGHALVSQPLEEAGFLAAFTERDGGVSEHEFASLNLSYSSGDDPDGIAENRRRVIESLSIEPFALGGQVHGADIREVTQERRAAGFDGSEGVISSTDGLWTDASNRSIAIATADCVPVILGSAPQGRVVAVHAGWRGVADGIVRGAAELFERHGDVIAAIGPAAGPCCYEVGPEVVEAVSEAVPGGAVVDRREGRIYLDLVSSIRQVLTEEGIGTVHDSGLCTISERDRFFSHRRDGPCGRQLAIAVRRS